MLFDRIVVPLLEGVTNFLEPAYASELDWLRGQNAVCGVDPIAADLLGADTEMTPAEYIDHKANQLKQTFRDQNVLARQKFPKRADLLVSEERMDQIVEQYYSLYRAFWADQMFARAMSARLSVPGTRDVVPVFEDARHAFVAGKSDVLEIIVKSMPQPLHSTPWEQIIDFRKDPDSKAKLTALRVWVNDIAKGNLSASEIAQKLEYLVSEYEAHMKVHRIKAETGTLEAIVTTTAEVVEDLAKLKLKDAAKLLFEVKHRKLDLLEAEMKAPGKELAFVALARHRFRR